MVWNRLITHHTPSNSHTTHQATHTQHHITHAPIHTLTYTNIQNISSISRKSTDIHCVVHIHLYKIISNCLSRDTRTLSAILLAVCAYAPVPQICERLVLKHEFATHLIRENNEQILLILQLRWSMAFDALFLII